MTPALSSNACSFDVLGDSFIFTRRTVDFAEHADEHSFRERFVERSVHEEEHEVFEIIHLEDHFILLSHRHLGNPNPDRGFRFLEYKNMIRVRRRKFVRSVRTFPSLTHSFLDTKFFMIRSPQSRVTL
jgi:hypothetical protein